MFSFRVAIESNIHIYFIYIYDIYICGIINQYYYTLITFVSFLLQIRIREVAPKMVQLLTEWTETFPYDFRDERMMLCLRDMGQHLARADQVPNTNQHSAH